MTLDATIPDGSEMVEELAEIHRETRAAVNAAVISAVTAAMATEVTLTALQTELVVGVDVNDVPMETVFVTTSFSNTLAMINGSRSGHIKIIQAQSTFTVSNVDGFIELNQPIADPSLSLSQYDVLALVNLGGDPALGQNGYWRELFRTLNTHP